MKNIFTIFIVVVLFCLNGIVCAQEITMHVSKTSYNEDFSLSPFIQNEHIYSLGVSGSFNLKSDSSLCRIILVDADNKEYMVFESYSILSGLGYQTFTRIYEEAKYLDGIIPSQIVIQLIDATCTLDSVTIGKTATTNSRVFQKTYMNEINLDKVRKINKQIKLNGMIWSAWLTPTGSLSYEQKKATFGDRYNIRGFEYYKDGFFQSSLHKTPLNPTTSVIVSRWDWRSRHNANNSRKPDGTLNTCYYDNDPDGSGWMTPPRYQNGCWLNNQLQVILDPECTNQGGVFLGVPTCWSFSPCNATEGVENLYFNKHIDTRLSEQDVIMCGGYGYNGGLEYYTLEYLKNPGVVDWDCYPYPAAPTPCNTKCSNPTDITKITNYVTVYDTLTSDQIKEMLISSGPITCRPPWSHTYCLVGYDIIQEGDYIDQLGNIPVPSGSPYIGQTYWICKNSVVEVGYGTNHQAYSYTMDLPLPRFCSIVLPIISQAHPESEKRILDCDGDGFYNWGIGSKPANCPPGTPDEEDCDDSDPRLRGQDPITHKCMINCSNFIYVNVPEIIPVSTTWNYDQIKDHDVIIPSGCTLTIKSEIQFVSQARLIVQIGGRLLLDGGHLTSACSNFWKGVEVWGNSSLSQTLINQGSLNVYNNGTIENAEIGILSGKRSGSGFDDNCSGGIVNANHGIFRNNGFGIYVRPYTQFSSNPSFTACNFSTTPDIIDINQFDSFIKVSDISSVIATGSSFINSYSSDPSGTGIYATGAGITVGAWCSVTSISPCPEQDLVHCTFSNLRIGIYAINTPGSHSVNVSRSDFYAVQKGIYLSAYSSSTLVLNTINIPEPAGGIQSYPGPYGMYLDNCTLYHIEGNTFQSTVAVPTTIGLVVNNSGTDANVIYRNTFLDLKYNTVAQDVNRNSSSTTGLCYVCNSFKTPLATPSYNTVAIVVTHTGNYSPSYGIARYQNAVFGGITVPAFNRFYNASVPAIPQYYDIFNNCYSIDSYLYPLIYNLNNGYTFRPLNHSANVTLIQSSISFSNQCPDLIDYGGTQSKDSLILNGGSEGKWNINGLDSLVDILISRNTIDSYYDLAFLYLQNRKIEMAQDILLKIPSQFSFTSDDQKNYEAFISLFNIIKVRMTSSVNQLDLDEQQTIALIQISEKCHNRLGSYARNMLIASKKINYIEPIILPAFDRTMMNQEQDDNGTQVINGCLKAHPNPANKYIIVDYDLSSKSYSKAGIKVFSSVGKLLVDEHLIMNKTQITINTEEWSSGLYLLKLELDGNVIETTKISIIK